MDEDELTRLRKLIDEMKREGEFLQVTSKKNKGVIASAGTSSSSGGSAGANSQKPAVGANSQKPTNTSVNNQSRVNNPQNLVNNQTRVNNPQRMVNNQGRGAPNPQIFPNQGRPLQYANVLVKDWYNKNLRKEAWEVFNNCYRAQQSADLKTVNYWFSQVERLFLNEEQRSSALEAKLNKVTNMLNNLVMFSSTSKSKALEVKEKSLISDIRNNELQLILQSMETNDMVNVRMHELLEILKFVQIQGEQVHEFEAEGTIQQMLTMFQQRVINEEKLIQFFKKLEDTNISQLLENEELIRNPMGRLRAIACFQEIPKYKVHIKKGLVHEVYLNTKNPEEYGGAIPEICALAANSHASKFQSIFKFRIWAIWEERQHIKLFPSTQIWELHRVTDDPCLSYEKFLKQNFSEEHERELAAEDFFSRLNVISLERIGAIGIAGNILLVDYIAHGQDFGDKYRQVTNFFNNLNLGGSGLRIYEDRLAERELGAEGAEPNDPEDDIEGMEGST